jgi:hypothetical protein
MRAHKAITYRVDERGCWICTSHAPNGMGYAMLRTSNGRQYVHRYMYEQRYGSIPHGTVIRHCCDVPLCINPEHLLAGTQRDNIEDCISRGRHKASYDEHNGQTKLSRDQVNFIREHTEIPDPVLAKMFHVSRPHISLIQSGRKRKRRDTGQPHGCSLELCHG